MSTHSTGTPQQPPIQATAAVAASNNLLCPRSRCSIYQRMNGRVPRPHSLQHGASHTDAMVPDSPALPLAHGKDIRGRAPRTPPIWLTSTSRVCQRASWAGARLLLTPDPERGQRAEERMRGSERAELQPPSWGNQKERHQMTPLPIFHLHHSVGAPKPSQKEPIHFHDGLQLSFPPLGHTS